MDKKHILFYSAIILVLATMAVFIGRSLSSPDENEIKTISIESGNYNNPGSWKVNKSAKWVDINKAQIEFEVNSVLKTDDVNYKDIILIMDISGSMEGDKIDRAKEDAIGLTQSILSNPENKMALIIFNGFSEIKSSFTSDRNEIVRLINELYPYGGTNYNSPLKDADVILSNYQKQSNRDLALLFLTDGYPNEENPNQIATYHLLKEKHPYMTIHGIQYEMGETVIEEIKEISDKQWIADMETLDNVLFEATTTPFKYDKFEVTDYINNNYFIVESINNISVDKGKAELTEEGGTQKVTWNIDNLYSGFVAKMTIDVSLKEELNQEEGLYPTNLRETIESSLVNDEDNVSITSDQTPTLKHGYKVTYYPNAPQGCNLGSNTIETHYAFEKVNKWTNKLTCEGYLFKGWEITSEDKLGTKMINDDTFIMPTYNVDIKAVWTKQDIIKSMNGVVHENENTLYRVMQDYATEGKYAKEYTGPHQDSYDGSGTKPIYHWATQDKWDRTTGAEIRDKYYVKFGDFCWMMMRTTDLGGVRMIYSGPYSPTNKCQRVNQGISYGYYETVMSIKNTYNNPNYYYKYYYGDDFVYNENTHTFKLAGNIFESEIHEDTIDDFIGLYTCEGYSADYECTRLYKIAGKKDDTTVWLYQYYYDYVYNSIGTTRFNQGDVVASVAGIGYMYGDWTQSHTTDSFIKHSYAGNNKHLFETYTIENRFYFADSVELVPPASSNSCATWRGVNMKPLSAFSDYSELIGKYFFPYSTYKTCTARKVIDIQGRTMYLLESVEIPGTEGYYNPELINFAFGDSATSNDDGTVTLNNIEYSKASDIASSASSYINKYFCLDGSTRCEQPRKITDAYFSYSYLYYDYKDGNEYIMISKTRDGLNLVNPELVNKYDLINNLENYSEYHYTCGDRSTTCTKDNMMYILRGYEYSTSDSYLSGVKIKHYYGSNVTWDGHKYTLVDPQETEILFSDEKLTNHHYFCLEPLTTSCEKVGFIYSQRNDSGLEYILLENGQNNPKAILDEMINGNKYDSWIKTAIEDWYEKNMTKYTNYLEDSTYCNNRDLIGVEGWDPNGNPTGSFKTKANHDNPEENIKCDRVADQFSTSNPYAKTKYPVGLMSMYEMALINNQYARENYVSWITMTARFESANSGIYPLRYYGNFASTAGGGYSIVPAITLKYGTQYDSGDGSINNPYMVDTSEVDSND